MPEQSWPNTHISNIRQDKAFLSLGTLNSSTSPLCFGAVLNSDNTNKKWKNVKNVALSRLWKEAWLTQSRRAETKRWSITLFSFSWACTCAHQETSSFTTLSPPAPDRESTPNDFGVTNTFWKIGKYAKIEPANKKVWLNFSFMSCEYLFFGNTPAILPSAPQPCQALSCPRDFTATLPFAWTVPPTHPWSPGPFSLLYCLYHTGFYWFPTQIINLCLNTMFQHRVRPSRAWDVAAKRMNKWMNCSFMNEWMASVFLKCPFLARKS